MRHATHIDKHEDLDETIKYYVDNFDAVELVTCNNCGKPMCLWYLDRTMAQAHMSGHHEGKQRVTLSGHLQATRKRFDGRMGYHCDCGNDSRLAAVEEGIVPVLKYNQHGRVMNPEVSLDVYPHHEAAVRLVMARDGDLAKVKDLKGKQVIDNFIHERLN